ncbi:MAG: adenylate cyclase [Pseudonocardiales bacterium]|nr:adenylate cyclase [Pseudonocardiales bacterium]
MSGVWLVVAPGTRAERVVRVNDRVHIGRDCSGIDPSRRVIVDDPAVSRDHAEVQVVSGSAFLVDHSTNGTRVNGRRVERGERVALVDGDTITIGDVRIALRATGVVVETDDARRTIAADSVDECVVLVGDVVGYTGLTEVHGAAAVGAAVDGLFRELRRIVVGHLGTVSNFAGDAILAVWEHAVDARAATAAVQCAHEAHRYATDAATLTTVRYADGGPIRFGWSVTTGPVATSHPSPARIAVHGDAVNLAFRLAGLAGRGELAPLLIESAVVDLASDAASYGDELSLAVKGRQLPARVRPVIG